MDSRSRPLLTDGHDTETASRASPWFHQDGILVVSDFYNLYPGVEALLEHVDYLLACKYFRERITNEGDFLKSSPMIHPSFKSRFTAATRRKPAYFGTQLRQPGRDAAAMPETHP